MSWLEYILKNKKSVGVGFLFVLLAIYSAYKTFTPAEVKKVEVERIVSDVKTESSLRQTIATLKQQIKNFTRNIHEDEVLVEKYDPATGKLVERRIEKKKVTSETGNSTTVASSTKTATSEIDTTKKTTTNKKTEQITNPNPLWTSMFGFQYFDKQVIVGQGMNIGKSFTGMVMGSYKFKEGLSEKDRWDLGGSLIYRY